MFEEADVIYSYTRKQAIEDGVLVDVTETAKECGFKYPVAVTRAVWDRVIVPDDGAKAFGQSEAGRLWDVLWILHVTIARSPGPKDTLFYSLLVSDGEKSRTVRLKSVCGPGDDMTPTITIMMPDQD